MLISPPPPSYVSQLRSLVASSSPPRTATTTPSSPSTAPCTVPAPKTQGLVGPRKRRAANTKKSWADCWWKDYYPKQKVRLLHRSGSGTLPQTTVAATLPMRQSNSMNESMIPATSSSSSHIIQEVPLFVLPERRLPPPAPMSCLLLRQTRGAYYVPFPPLLSPLAVETKNAS